MADHRVPIEDLPNIDPASLRPIDVARARRAGRAHAPATHPDALWITPDALLLALRLGGGGAPSPLVRRGAMTGVMNAQIDWLPLSLGGVRPTQGKTLAVMQVSGGSQSFNAVNQMRILGRSTIPGGTCRVS